MEFTRRCGVCFNEFKNSGYVLCCGDFLCHSCFKINPNPSNCLLCKKNASERIDLSNVNQIPEEVLVRLEDSTDIMEKLYETMEFQVKNYKRLISGLIENVDSKNR